MTEALKCPECSAPLQLPPAGGTSMRCPYCNTTVLIPGSAPQSAPQMGGATIDLSEILKLVSSGNKIGAIRLYRQMSGAGLAAAKEAVERHAAWAGAAGTLNFNFPNPAKVASSIVRTVVIGMLLIWALVAYIIYSSMHRQTTKIKPPRIPATALQQLQGLGSPSQPAFAHLVLEFGSEGIGAGGFKDARSIAADGDGNLFVGEYSGGRIQVFNAGGKFLATWSIGKNKSLLNLAADRHGNLYAAVPGHIYRYEAMTGKPLGEVDNPGEFESLNYFDVFIALDGGLYSVCDNHKIVEFAPDGKIKRTIDCRDKVGEEVAFQRVAVIGTGEIFALDREKGIFKFSSDGRYINRFAGGGTFGRTDKPGKLFSPRNLAVDNKGRLYVTDSNFAVNVFDSDGGYLASFGGTDVAFGLAITDKDEIYACYRNKHSIRKFVLDKG